MHMGLRGKWITNSTIKRLTVKISGKQDGSQAQSSGPEPGRGSNCFKERLMGQDHFTHLLLAFGRWLPQSC